LSQRRKFPQFPQNEIFSLSDAFQRLDVDDKGYIDEATAIKATQQSENQPYDVVRQALKEVELDSSRRVELEDYVGVRYFSDIRLAALRLLGSGLPLAPQIF
jgi:plastin-1